MHHTGTHGRSLGLVAHTFEPGPGSGLIQMIAIKRYLEHFGLSRTILFLQKKKSLIVALTLHRRGPETNLTDLISSGIFIAAPSLKYFHITPCKPAIRYLCIVPQMPYAPQMLFTASLNNYSMIIGIYALKHVVLLMLREWGQIVNRSGFSRARMKGSRASVDHG
jgi:hypothetical protein